MSSAFFSALERSTKKAKTANRTWVYVPYDQLTDQIGPLARLAPEDAGIVLVESPAKAARRPYHKQKLAMVLANQRHFALEQAARGVAVRYEIATRGTASALAAVVRKLGPLTTMVPAERELRVELASLIEAGGIVTAPHEGWLTRRDDFVRGAGPRAPWRMDAFYRYARQKSGILMQGQKPIGGKYSFDAENRKPWRGSPPAPAPPRFEVDAVTEEVGRLVDTHFAHHPGTLTLDTLPVTLAHAEQLWAWARAECLPHFGPFEDAMSTRSARLFHTGISPLLNLHRLLPARVVRDVAQDDTLELASREGFIRQILGWREFVRHVHDETDGFRNDPAVKLEAASGDGGFGRWRGKAWPPSSDAGDAGAAPSALDAHHALPDAYWGTASGMHCLDHVVETVWRDGSSHHITRLMVLSNIATLLGYSPRELTDWFWVAYVDAYDWVVEPNVLAMSTHGVGDLMTTKPYVSGAAYINKMSDYCSSCAFDPKSNCPITRLYWAFLGRHEARFAKNPRMVGPLASLRKRSAEERAADVRTVDHVRAVLGRGEKLTPNPA